MQELIIRPERNLAPELLEPLVLESEHSGLRFVRRLADELRNGTNRYEQTGECLFVAYCGAMLVGVCGLNIDPFLADPTVGRVRRLYVLAAKRGSGIGRQLLQAVVEAARGRFTSLRVRTESQGAGQLYENLGFVPVIGGDDCTHILQLTDVEAGAGP